MPTYASTANFDLSIDDIAEEAYERCGLQIRSGYDLQTARRSLNILLSEWANRGLNLWTIQLQEKTLPANTTSLTGTNLFGSDADDSQQIVDITDVVIRDSSNNDFAATSISRSTYFNFTTKTTSGRPTQYYISMKKSPDRLVALKQIYEDEFQRAAAQDGERTSLFLTPKTYFPSV
jgi:hypothetical protein